MYISCVQVVFVSFNVSRKCPCPWWKSCCLAFAIAASSVRLQVGLGAMRFSMMVGSRLGVIVVVSWLCGLGGGMSCAGPRIRGI